MSVKRQSRPTKADSRIAQGAATRASLIAAARKLFGSKGFGDTSLDEVVAEARVTKGALYHHYRGKEDLFAAVYEQVLRELSDRVVVEFLRPDPLEALLFGCERWVDEHLDPAVQRIVMRDARAVLDWDVIRDIEARYGAVPLRGVMRPAMRKGLLATQPLRPLALMLMGALNEACFYVVDADDSVAARQEVHLLIVHLLAGLAVGADHPAPGVGD